MIVCYYVCTRVSISKEEEKEREREKKGKTNKISFFLFTTFCVRSFLLFWSFLVLLLTFSKKGEKKKEKKKKKKRKQRLPLFSKRHFFKERERKGQPLFLSFFSFFWSLSFCSFPSHFFFPFLSKKSSSFLASFLRRRGVAAVRLRRRRRGGNT